MANNSIYRERFRLTLEHKSVDRCPIDLGGTPQSTVESVESVSKLASYLGFTGTAPDDYDKFDRRVIEHWDVDFRRVGCLVPFKTNRCRSISETEYVDEYGIRRRYSGLYWEIEGGPLAGATTDEVDAYELPGLDHIPSGILDGYRMRAENLNRHTDYVVVGEHPVFGVLELACWLCGYDHIMLMMAADPDFVHLLFGKILDFQKQVIRAYYENIGCYIHLTTSGDDFGTQKSLFMSPGMWREFVKPYMRERIEYTARFTDAVYMHHSCGAIYDIIPDLIEIGVKILNPIQPNATFMQPDNLKNSFGKQIVFHGGLDTQEVLPSGDPMRIGRAVDELLNAMRPWSDGGYIFAPAHNLQADVAPASVAVMYDRVAKGCAR